MYVCSTVVTVDVEVRMRRQAASMIVAFWKEYEELGERRGRRRSTHRRAMSFFRTSMCVSWNVCVLRLPGYTRGDDGGCQKGVKAGRQKETNAINGVKKPARCLASKEAEPNAS